MATINATSGPLAGVKVIDATTIVLGPYATQMLGDMGADIIKIEAPGAGDLMRNMGPGRNPGMSGLFLNINRNKRSVVLDLKQQRGKQVLRRLIQGADVFFHNMRAQAIIAVRLVMHRLDRTPLGQRMTTLFRVFLGLPHLAAINMAHRAICRPC